MDIRLLSFGVMYRKKHSFAFFNVAFFVQDDYSVAFVCFFDNDVFIALKVAYTSGL